ncbi:MAG: T9SS type A sorting domain-containing protein [Bacteroidia bacterium]
MKARVLFFLLLCIPFISNAQLAHRFYEFNIEDVESRDCNGKSVTNYKHLDVYVTKNDKFFGERDTTFCFDRKELTFPDLPNAIKIDNSLEDRMIWIADTSIDIPFIKDSVLQFLDDSYRRNCRIKENERWLLVETFDTTLKQYVIDTMALNPGSEYCYCGNKFYRNIKALYVGVKPWDITSDAYVVSKAGLAYQKRVKVVTDSLHTQIKHNDSTYGFNYWGRHGNYVFANPDTNLFSDKVNTITIEPYEPESKRVTIEAELMTGVFVQPFVNIKGGIYDSVKNIRHKLNLYLIDSNVCFQHYFIELVFNGDDELHFYNNQLHHRYSRSCLMFEQKAKLIIEKDGHLEFGNDGNGILAVKPGASIELEPNADLTINGQLALLDYKDWIQGGNVDVHLKPGNKLTFGEGATVSNRVFEHGSVKLHVYMEGGELDLSNLDEKSKELIVVYNSTPQFVLPNLDQVNPYPNPTNGQFFMEFRSDVLGVLNWQLQDLKGNQIQGDIHSVKNGYNLLDFNLGENRPGVYILSFDLLGETYYRKVVLVNK